MNKSDGERVAAVLEKTGYKSALDIQGADLVVINMCSIRQSAVDRVYGLINKIPKNKKVKSILTGCILKKDLKKFKKIFDFVLNIKTLERWPEILQQDSYCYYPNPRDEKLNKVFNTNYLKTEAKPLSSFSALIPISTGCNNFCSYCAVPFARGPLICRPHQEIVREVKRLVKAGFREIWLLGQNVNDYESKNIQFPELLSMINDIPGNFWIRFTSPHPKDFSEKTIKVMTECNKITPYLNLPVQSGDNKVLKKMNRPYTIEKYKKLVKKIREKIPNICLSTDVIVAFPGETKKQFENTVKLFKEIEYDMAYIAIYSPRPQTTAAKLKNTITRSEKQKRYDVLTEIIKKTALKNNKKYINKTVDVLVSDSKQGSLTGKTKSYKTVRLRGPKNLVGKFIKVKITEPSPWGLKGTLQNNTQNT